MRKNLFVIGNGFDLDLGMRTKYSDFANNEKYWPKGDRVETIGLKTYLEKKRNLEKWFDMENELRNYSIYEDVPPIHIDSMIPDRDMKYFEKIREKLMEYLFTQEIIEFNTESVAAKVLKAVCNNGYFTSCYSFNYTDFNNIMQKLGICQQISYTHIHGNIKERSVILGVDQVKLREGYNSIKKINSPSYQSNSIKRDLENSDEIVFFGISFGMIDSVYFKSFLKSITSTESILKERRITIFTYDGKSEIEIKENLSNLGIDFVDLSQNKISFIKTRDNMDSDKLDDFCNRLNKESKLVQEQEKIKIKNEILNTLRDL